MHAPRTAALTVLASALFAGGLVTGCTDGASELVAPPETTAGPALGPAAPNAAARSGVSQRFDVAGTVWNRCTGEYVQVTGTMTRVFSLHEDSGGGYHWLSNYAIHGTALGLTSGNPYVYNEIHNRKENGDLPFESLFDDTGAYYFTMSFIATLISKGPSANQTFQWDIRYKMDRTGAVTMDELHREFLCHG